MKEEERCWKEKLLLFFCFSLAFISFCLSYPPSLSFNSLYFYCYSTFVFIAIPLFFYNSPLLPKRAAVCRYTIMEKSRLIHFSRSGICYCCCYTIYLMSFVVLNIKSLSLMTFFMVKVAIEMEAGMWAQVWRSFFLMHSKKLPLQCTQFSIFFLLLK